MFAMPSMCLSNENYVNYGLHPHVKSLLEVENNVELVEYVDRSTVDNVDKSVNNSFYAHFSCGQVF